MTTVDKVLKVTVANVNKSSNSNVRALRSMKNAVSPSIDKISGLKPAKRVNTGQVVFYEMENSQIDPPSKKQCKLTKKQWNTLQEKPRSTPVVKVGKVAKLDTRKKTGPTWKSTIQASFTEGHQVIQMAVDANEEELFQDTDSENSISSLSDSDEASDSQSDSDNSDVEEGLISAEEDHQTWDSLEQIDKEMQKIILDLHD